MDAAIAALITAARQQMAEEAAAHARRKAELDALRRAQLAEYQAAFLALLPDAVRPYVAWEDSYPDWFTRIDEVQIAIPELAPIYAICVRQESNKLTYAVSSAYMRHADRAETCEAVAGYNGEGVRFENLGCALVHAQDQGVQFREFQASARRENDDMAHWLIAEAARRQPADTTPTEATG